MLEGECAYLGLIRDKLSPQREMTKNFPSKNKEQTVQGLKARIKGGDLGGGGLGEGVP